MATVGIHHCELLTALGDSLAMNACAVKAGISALSEHPFMLDMAGYPYKVAMVPVIAAQETRRLQKLLSLHLDQVLHALPDRAFPLQALVNLPAPRPGLPDTLCEEVLGLLKTLPTDKPVHWVVESLGRMGGALAVEAAAKRVTTDSGWVLVVSADSYLNAETLAWLDASGQLYTQANAWGMVPGEAVASLLLGADPTCPQLQAVAIADEPDARLASYVCTGQGLTQALDIALERGGHAKKICSTYCDSNGQVLRSDEMGFLFTRRGECFEKPGDIQTPADSWGDIGAASLNALIGLACTGGSGEALLLASTGGVYPGESEESQRAAVLINRAESVPP